MAQLTQNTGNAATAPPSQSFNNEIRRRKFWAALEGYMYLAPTLIILTVFVFIPIVSSFQLSLTRVAPFGNAVREVGLANYERFYERLINAEQGGEILVALLIGLAVGFVLISGFAKSQSKPLVRYKSQYQTWAMICGGIFILAIVDGALRISLLFTLGTTIPGIILSVFLAIALSMPVRRFSWFHRLLIFVPIVISSAVTGVLFRWIYHPVVGYINYILDTVGVEGPNWLSDADWALVAVMIAVVWRQIGFNVIIALAGLQNIDSSYYEAAKVDGASLWRQIRHITLPLLSPTLFFLFVINTINSLQVFGEIDVLTQGGPGETTRTLLYDIYFLAFRGTPQRGIASAESIILLVLIVILSLVQFRVANRRVHYQ
ncbi:MAG: carbohydrate ABC transporter permease [Aggregatilineales bacterium]